MIVFPQYAKREGVHRKRLIEDRSLTPLSIKRVTHHGSFNSLLFQIDLTTARDRREN